MITQHSKRMCNRKETNKASSWFFERGFGKSGRGKRRKTDTVAHESHVKEASVGVFQSLGL